MYYFCAAVLPYFRIIELIIIYKTRTLGTDITNNYKWIANYMQTYSLYCGE